MLLRFFFAYGGFTLAITAISWAMLTNGSAHPKNPAWAFVTSTRDLCLWGWFGIFMLGLLALFIRTMPQMLSHAPPKPRARPVPREEGPNEPYQPPLPISEQSRPQHAEEERQKIEIARTPEVANLRKIEEQKKVRSARDAVNAALGDFM